MKTHTPVFLTPAQDLARQVFDVFYFKEASDRMSSGGAPNDALEAMDSGIRGRLDDINYIFRHGVAHEANKGAFASEFSHALRAEFAKKGAVKGTWVNEHMQRLVSGGVLDPELFACIHVAAFPVSKIAIGSGIATAAKEAETPALDHAQEFAVRLKAGLESHAAHLKLLEDSKRPRDQRHYRVVAEHYKEAAASFSRGLQNANDVKAYHAEASAAVGRMVAGHPHIKATLLNPEVKEALEKHIGTDIADFLQNATLPEIAAKKAADAAATAASTASAVKSAAAQTAAGLEKAATRMSGSAKWLVAGAGAAVALGALMHLDGKSHTRSAKNRANNPLNDAALAR